MRELLELIFALTFHWLRIGKNCVDVLFSQHFTLSRFFAQLHSSFYLPKMKNKKEAEDIVHPTIIISTRRNTNQRLKRNQTISKKSTSIAKNIKSRLRSSTAKSAIKEEEEDKKSTQLLLKKTIYFERRDSYQIRGQ
jgi:hypothetical protein